jgi:hypothetical protein
MATIGLIQQIKPHVVAFVQVGIFWQWLFHISLKIKKTFLDLKGKSHEKVGKMRVEGDSLGPN